MEDPSFSFDLSSTFSPSCTAYHASSSYAALSATFVVILS